MTGLKQYYCGKYEEGVLGAKVGGGGGEQGEGGMRGGAPLFSLGRQ